MPYRVPGAYARFIQRPSAVNNVGATRALGLIGTGANYFEVYNEAIKKSSTQSYDNLKQKNVFEIISVTNKALSNGVIVKGSTVYTEGANEAFTLKEHRMKICRAIIKRWKQNCMEYDSGWFL